MIKFDYTLYAFKTSLQLLHFRFEKRLLGGQYFQIGGIGMTHQRFCLSHSVA